MIKKLAIIMAVLGVVLSAGLVAPLTANAIGASTNPIAAQCADDPTSTVCQQSTSSGSLIKNIVNTLLFVVGAIAVIMVIVGGIMFATSAGDSGRVTTGKNILSGAIIGLVVSVLAFAVVQFVFSKFK